MPHRVRVTLYTKPRCHLCDEAREEMWRAGCRDDYTFEEVDIESDPALLRRYGLEIPVVAIDGIVTFKHRVAAEEFRRQIRQARAV